MSAPNDSGPAFPVMGKRWHPDGGFHEVQHGGMTLRQYAAIHLRVPNSGDDWLDDMIREAQRNDFAAKAMQGVLSNSDNGGGSIEPMLTFLIDPARDGCEWVARVAYRIADAMLAARGAA